MGKDIYLYEKTGYMAYITSKSIGFLNILNPITVFSI